MIRIISFFFLVIMALDVTLPLWEQLQQEDVCEWTKSCEKDADEDGKKESDKAKESKVIPFHTFVVSPLSDAKSELIKYSPFIFDGHLHSEYHGALPFLPPEV